MTSFLPQIGSENPTSPPLTRRSQKKKQSLLELSQNVEDIRHEGMDKRIRARSHDPGDENGGKENRKRKSRVDRSKSQGRGEEKEAKARRRYVFDDTTSKATNDKSKTNHAENRPNFMPKDQVDNKKGSADKRVHFGGTPEESQQQVTVPNGITYARSSGAAVGVQYRILGAERHGVRLGNKSPTMASSPKGQRRGVSPTGSPKRTRSPGSPTRARSPYAAKRHKHTPGDRGRTGSPAKGQREMVSPKYDSDRMSPKGSPPIGSMRTHQARLEATRMKARVWAETYSDPGPPPSEKIVK